MIKMKDLQADSMKDDAYRREYEALEGEFKASANPRIGESFDDFLRDEGLLEEVTATALARRIGKPPEGNGLVA